MEIDLSCLLIVGQTKLLGQGLHLLHDEPLEVPVAAEGGEGVAGNAPPLCPLLDGAVSGHHHSNHTGLERVSMYIALGNVVTVAINTLNVLRSHVVTIGQLEDLLLVVDDLKGPVGLPLAHVPSVEPALAVHHGSGHLGVSVVRDSDRM